MAPTQYLTIQVKRSPGHIDIISPKLPLDQWKELIAHTARSLVTIFGLEKDGSSVFEQELEVRAFVTIVGHEANPNESTEYEANSGSLKLWWTGERHFKRVVEGVVKPIVEAPERIPHSL